MQAEKRNPLKGSRILVVEDEMLLAMALEDLLLDHEAEVLGPLATVERALKFLAADQPDCVTLDMNLKGELSLPIAEDLIRRAIPFVVVSGYAQNYPQHAELRAAPFLRKPYSDDDLVAALRSILG